MIMLKSGSLLVGALLLLATREGVHAKKKKAGHDIAADLKFLEEKGAEEGVVSLDSGALAPAHSEPWPRC